MYPAVLCPQGCYRWKHQGWGPLAITQWDERSQDTSGFNSGPWQCSPSLTTVPLIGSVDNAGTLNLHGNTLKTWIHSPPGAVLYPLCPDLVAHRKPRQKENIGSRENRKRVKCRGNIYPGTSEIGWEISTASCFQRTKIDKQRVSDREKEIERQQLHLHA